VAALFPFRALLDPDMSVALVTAAAAPVAAMVAMFAARYDRDVELAVGLVSATTLVSLLTLPAVVGLALSLLGRS
jgi:predicted permease